MATGTGPISYVSAGVGSCRSIQSRGGSLGHWSDWCPEKRRQQAL